MALLYIPCLNVDNPNQDTGLSVGVGVGGAGGEAGTTPTPGIAVSHPDVPVTLTIIPVPPFFSLGINWKWWGDLFGLGETRIEREKEQIQDVYTPIFRFLRKGYGFPLRDGHALQMSSEYVEKMFTEDDFKRRAAQGMYEEANELAQSVFVDDTPSTGQRKRIVNQFLANAHINEWPANAWILAWRGLVAAAPSDCRKDQGRWMKNPMLIDDIARYSALLHYMPLGNFASAVAQHKVADPSGRKLLTHWLQNPRLVEAIPQVLEIPPWGVPYRSKEDGGGQSGNPYETQQIAEREPILRLWEGVTWQRPWYPTLQVPGKGGLPQGDAPIEPSQPPSDPDNPQAPNPPPYPQDPDLPPAQPGPQSWPQYPNCPPWQQPDQPDGDGGQQPDGPLEPQQPDNICDPDCQVQIDYLLERARWIENMQTLGILPRLDNIEEWLADLERRVPGPMPDIPVPSPWPPYIPPLPPTEPETPIPGWPPTVPQPPLFDELCVEYLKKLCDPLTRCEELQKCERELECAELTLCDESGGVFGAIAECWLEKKTPPSTNLHGAYGQANLIDALSNAIVATSFETLGPQGTGQGEGPAELRPYAQYWPGRAIEEYSDKIIAVLEGQSFTHSHDDYADIFQREYIFSDPVTRDIPSLKVRQPKLREGEIDPCATEVGQ